MIEGNLTNIQINSSENFRKIQMHGLSTSEHDLRNRNTTQNYWIKLDKILKLLARA